MRIAAAAMVLVGGLIVAVWFRHDSPRNGPPVLGTGERLVLRNRMERQMDRHAANQAAGAERRLETPDRSAASAPIGGRPATVLTPLDPRQPPPPLPRSYPAAVSPGNPAESGAGQGLASAAPPGEQAATHTIVDGDTLSGLAERYLGSADRYLEIYEANRGVLPSPRVLPIGAELKIPLGPRTNPSPSNLMPKRPLVPVTPVGQD